MQESRHAQNEEKEDQTRHEDPLAPHLHHLRDGRHASCPSDGRWRETGAGNRVAMQMEGGRFRARNFGEPHGASQFLVPRLVARELYTFLAEGARARGGPRRRARRWGRWDGKLPREGDGD